MAFLYILDEKLNLMWSTSSRKAELPLLQRNAFG